MLCEQAPAKINLFLHVGTRRDDGFHPLQSLAVFTGAGADMLHLARADTLSLTLAGPFAGTLAAEADNLVLRAARLLQGPGNENTGAAITLTKNLPVASGIGGGSSDAAAALRGLRTLWNLPADEDALCALAAGLGSDVPVCVAARPAYMEGRGEVLTPLTALPRLSLLLVNPGVPVPTGPVFAALQARRGVGMALPRGFVDTGDLLRFLEETGNDLQAPALALQPVIGQVLKEIAARPGALLARMSGSGATCFGLFAGDDSCARAAGALAAAHPGWWCVAGCVPALGAAAPAAAEQDIGPTPEGL